MQQSEWTYVPNCRVPSGHSLPIDICRYAAIVSYDGADFCGFQKQKHSPSVQSVIEAALSYVADEPVIVGCAGRTDTGVHASHQVVHFDTKAIRSGRNWVMGANSQLPDSVSLMWADRVSHDFHARFSATARTYRYVIAAQKTRPAILASGITWVKNTLDIQLMNRACEDLLGEQDFSAFRGSGCQSLSPYRNVEHAQVYQSGQLMVFEITANAFVLHMVRNIIGSLLEIGLQRQDSGWIAELMGRRDRRYSASTASPCGLYLVNVRYPESHSLPSLPRGPVFLNNNLAGGV